LKEAVDWFTEHGYVNGDRQPVRSNAS